MGPISQKANGWECRLRQEIEAAAERPFAWGSHDCAIWALDVVSALRGQPSPADAWRGKYKTARGAMSAMRRQGWASIEAGARALFGEPLSTVRLAQRGDLILGPEDAVGICLGSQSRFVSPTGLVDIETKSCRMAWRT